MANCRNCGGPVRKDSTLGVCTRNPECAKVRHDLEEHARRNGEHRTWTGTCQVCGGTLQANNATGVCQRTSECQGEYNHIRAGGVLRPKCRHCGRRWRVLVDGACPGCREPKGPQGPRPTCSRCGKVRNRSKLQERNPLCVECRKLCACGKLKTPNSSECADCYNKNLGIRRFKDERPGKGYVMVSVPTGELDKNGRLRCRLIYEHRYTMEQVIGRELTSNEEVHHKNGVRDDNRPENLELWSTNQPKGQRIEDKAAWAKELLALYEPEALVA